jgi:AraC-like DNA-binding protein
MFKEKRVSATMCAAGCEVARITQRVERLLLKLKQARGMSQLYHRIMEDTGGLTVEEAARLCNMSHSNFRRKSKFAIQSSFHQFLVRLRLLRALGLVTRTPFPPRVDSIGKCNRRALRSHPHATFAMR